MGIPDNKLLGTLANGRRVWASSADFEKQQLRRERASSSDRHGEPGAEGVVDRPYNGSEMYERRHPDDPGPPEPPSARRNSVPWWEGDDPAMVTDTGHEPPEPTTWEPIDLGPWVRGEVTHPEPSMGIRRADGLKLIYAGREHAVLGETESGKTWLALGCVAAELVEAHRVVYVHYEESDPGSTVERLQLLGVGDDAILSGLRFYGPAKAPRREWVEQLVQLRPTLVVHDGVNEAMASLLSADTHTVDGFATFRRRLVTPFIRAGAAVLACDHLPRNADSARRDAYGTVHKGNVLDGARILLENVEPFGRNMRGVSHVFITKDRPGYLRSHGRPTKTPGKTYIGTLVIDAANLTPDYMALNPGAAEQPEQHDQASTLADTVYDVIDAQPDHTITSWSKVSAALRAAGHTARTAAIRDALDDLTTNGRLTETPGPNRATIYQCVPKCFPTPAD